MSVTSELNFQTALFNAERLELYASGSAASKANPRAPLWRNAVALLPLLRDRLLKVLVRPRSATRMQLVERVTLAPRHQLVLVEIDGERCLLTLAPNAGIGFHSLGARRLESTQISDEPCA
jgi:hypothetical protein